ncbi:zinc ribbon domain-containing protein [Serratia fonticola]|uniref:hypothetical protein n=1 Tax=Serratia fonticola TaxID=47917 RepID=UPI0021BB9312|nr:hypothetical protein [Serratia fonticola]
MSKQTEQKKTLTIEWLDDCPKCGHGQAAVTTFGQDDFLWSGDKVTCMKCGHCGEIDVDGAGTWVEWDAQKEARHG